MPPRLRQLALIAHITSSVGWIGAIAGFLSLAITSLTTDDGALMRAAYLGMNWIGWLVLVPASFASLLTGLLQAFGTPWGLFRHYWVLAKLLINLLANVVLLLYMLELGSAVATLSGAHAAELRTWSPVLHASTALLLLLVATTLSVYKPRGITPYGWRKRQERRLQALQQR
jgi:hypothetical protein